MAFGEVAMPITEHSAQILAGSWPSQSVMAWSGYAMAYSQAANNLFTQLNTQYDIKDILATMDGAFIESARGLAQGRETALMNRIEAYRFISGKAHWAANELHSTKSDLVEIVNKAEEDIQTSRANAEKAKAAALGNPAAIAAIESQLETSIATIVAVAKGEAQARDIQGATTVTGYSGEIATWTSPYVNHLLPQSGGIPDTGGLPATPAPATPAPGQDGGGATTKPVDYKRRRIPKADCRHRAAQDNATTIRRRTHRRIFSRPPFVMTMISPKRRRLIPTSRLRRRRRRPRRRHRRAGPVAAAPATRPRCSVR